MDNKLKFCQKKQSNWKHAHCAGIAEFVVTLGNKNPNNKLPTVTQYRCKEHQNTGTVNKSVIESNPIDQSELIKEIQNNLVKYIGKEIYSSRERNLYPLIGKYIKGCGIMCNPNNRSHIWKYVYYDQIINL